MIRDAYPAQAFSTLAVVICGVAVHALSASAYELPQSDIDTLRALAEGGDASAQFELGFRYNTGAGVTADAAAGADWYRKAAAQGNPGAQYRLGFYLQYQQANPEEAVSWYQKAAEQGYAKAQMKLGECYLRGIGINQDQALADQWFSKAYAQGIARMFETNRLGCSQPLISAGSLEQSWEAKMARTGEPEEQMTLATRYLMIENRTKSLAWMLVAHDSGALINMSVLEELVARMTKEEIAEAEKFAADFIPVPGK